MQTSAKRMRRMVSAKLRKGTDMGAPNDRVSISQHHIDSARWELEWTYKDRVERLQRLSETLVTRLERNVSRLVTTGESDNGLGVLQGSGPELDRLCGEVEVAKSALATFDRMVSKAVMTS